MTFCCQIILLALRYTFFVVAFDTGWYDMYELLIMSFYYIVFSRYF